MTVKELIKELEQCDGELTVYGGYACDNPMKDVSEVYDSIQITNLKDESESFVVIRLE